jgi:predicted O-methyltransferase YrrM
MKPTVDILQSSIDLSYLREQSKMTTTYKDHTAQELAQLPMNDVYEIFLNSYKQLPTEFIKHREYFSQGRGFGEDAFHAMWYYLFEQYKPKNVLEIGVFRGQTISLFELLSRHFEYEADVWGLSPLGPVNDSVSQFPTNVEYEQDIALNYAFFDLGTPKLLKASSIEKKARQFIKSRKWDLIYIDGNHDLPYVISDYMNCAEALTDNGLMVIDDSSLNRNFSRPGSFKGHVAPSEIVDKLGVNEFDLILSVGHNNVLRNK